MGTQVGFPLNDQNAINIYTLRNRAITLTQGMTGQVRPKVGQMFPTTASAGANGSKILSGAGIPVNTLGFDDDLYINTVTADLYTKGSGAWVWTMNLKGTRGAPGEATKFLSSTGAPDPAAGNDGDFNLNLANGDVSKKILGIWVVQGNIRGPAGPASDFMYALDRPPDIAAASDDEFTDPTTLPGGANAKWSWINQNTAAVSIVNGTLVFDCRTDGGSWNSPLLTSTTPIPATDWEYLTKINVLRPINDADEGFLINFMMAGFFFRDATTGNICYFTATHHTNYATNQLTAGRWLRTAYVGGSDIGETGKAMWTFGPLWLRIRREGTVIRLMASNNGGKNWFRIDTFTSPWSVANPTQIGLFVENHQASYRTRGVFEYFRRTL